MNETNDIALICVPIWHGSDIHGMEQAPDILRAAISDSNSIPTVATTTEIPVDELQQNEPDNIWNVKHLESIVAINRQLASAVSQQLAAKRFVLTLGGDHSIGIGTVSGSLMHDKNVGVIWFDAHCDMNTETSSPTGKIHGMPLAALMGLCQSPLNDIPTCHVKPENIFWVGARDLDPGEQELAERLHLHIYSTKHIHQVGMKAVMEELRKEMTKQGIEHLHLSFDVDAFDPKLFPATSVRVADGLWMDDFDTFATLLPTLPKMIALDFVEYNPILDNENQDCQKMCKYFLNKLIQANQHDR